jgi:hypothetical protein
MLLVRPVVDLHALNRLVAPARARYYERRRARRRILRALLAEPRRERPSPNESAKLF